MAKKVIVGGLLGWVALASWTIVVNGIFGFRSSIDMKQIANERQVYMMLKDNIVEPGRYMCNPEMTSSGFPDHEPAYSILYSGSGHESAGRENLVQLVNALLMSLVATWMLSMSTVQIRQSYYRRVLFFTVIGLFLAVSSEIPKFGIGGYPFGDTLTLAVHDIIQWTVVGLLVAWRMKPETRA